MRKGHALAYGIGGAAVLILSFAITLWLTEPELPPAEKIRLLQASAISDEATLNAAARAVALKNSPYVRGHVDVLDRVDGSSVNISGWATETITIISKGAPIFVLVFSDGKNILSAQTQGERPDVTSALNLTSVAARNVAFTGQLTCNPQQKLIVAAATISGTYAFLGQFMCP